MSRNPKLPSEQPLVDREVLTTVEAANLLRMTERALYLAVQRGDIPALRLGKRRLRFSHTALLALLEPWRRPT